MNNKIPAEFVLKLLQLPNVGRVTTMKIISKADYQIENDNDLIRAVQDYTNGLKSNPISTYDFDNAFYKADQIIKRSDSKGIKMITYWDEDYPDLLTEIKDFPIVLYYKGNIKALSNHPTVAIIGSRNASNYGSKYGRGLAKKCAEKDFNIVSGLALGCDTVGHLGALDANGITTAVLAHGLDYIYPSQNKQLADQIVDNNGLLITEYVVNTKGLPQYFVQRDRIQAGLSLGTIVIETDVKGGTMHTVNYTINNGRKVACINYPNNLNASLNNEGNKMLIREGKALPIFDSIEIDDYLERISVNYRYPAKKEEIINNERSQIKLSQNISESNKVEKDTEIGMTVQTLSQPLDLTKDNEIFLSTRLADITNQLEKIKSDKIILIEKEKKLIAEKKKIEKRLGINVEEGTKNSKKTKGNPPL